MKKKFLYFILIFTVFLATISSTAIAVTGTTPEETQGLAASSPSPSDTANGKYAKEKFSIIFNAKESSYQKLEKQAFAEINNGQTKYVLFIRYTDDAYRWGFYEKDNQRVSNEYFLAEKFGEFTFEFNDLNQKMNTITVKRANAEMIKFSWPLGMNSNIKNIALLTNDVSLMINGQAAINDERYSANQPTNDEKNTTLSSSNTQDQQENTGITGRIKQFASDILSKKYIKVLIPVLLGITLLVVIVKILLNQNNNKHSSNRPQNGQSSRKPNNRKKDKGKIFGFRKGDKKNYNEPRRNSSNVNDEVSRRVNRVGGSTKKNSDTRELQRINISAPAYPPYVVDNENVKPFQENYISNLKLGSDLKPETPDPNAEKVAKLKEAMGIMEKCYSREMKIDESGIAFIRVGVKNLDDLFYNHEKELILNENMPANSKRYVVVADELLFIDPDKYSGESFKLTEFLANEFIDKSFLIGNDFTEFDIKTCINALIKHVKPAVVQRNGTDITVKAKGKIYI